MADTNPEVENADQDQGRGPFRRYFYRGLEVPQLLDKTQQELLELFHARARRKFNRGLSAAHVNLVKRLRKAKKAAGADGKPEVVKTHLRNMIILPEMVGSMVGVHNGSGFTQVEVKPDMIGYYLGEFAITYKPITHGRPGVGTTAASKFIPLK